jgi:predicted PurR-regulated permease PerM
LQQYILQFSLFPPIKLISIDELIQNPNIPMISRIYNYLFELKNKILAVVNLISNLNIPQNNKSLDAILNWMCDQLNEIQKIKFKFSNSLFGSFLQLGSLELHFPLLLINQ